MYSHVTFTVTYENIELWKGYLLSFVVSYSLFLFFNNANTVSAQNVSMGFWKSCVIQKSCQVTRLRLVHLLFPKPHTHISYSQYLHNVHLFSAHTSQEGIKCTKAKEYLRAYCSNPNVYCEFPFGLDTEVEQSAVLK